MQGSRINKWLAFGFIVASFLPWLSSSNVPKLIAKQRDVLLGRYSVDLFTVLFFLTPALWLAAYAFWSLRTHKPKEVVFRINALLLAIILGVVVVDVVGRFLRKPRYIERQVVHQVNWPGARVDDIVRHRPPDQLYKIRYSDAPPTARSYPSPPPGYPTVDVTLTTDARGYRNLTRLEQYDIVTVGDSFTEGSRVSDDEAWPVLLGGKLNQAVYNLGISGGHPDYYLNAFEAFGLALKPKTAVFMIYGGNDFKKSQSGRRSAKPFGERMRDTVKASPVVLGLKRAFTRYLGPINADAPVPGANILSWMPVAVPPGPDAKYYSFKPKRLVRLYWTKKAFRESEGWISTAQIFREIKALCAGEGIRLIFAYAPSKPEVVMPLVKERVTAEQLYTFASFTKRGLPPPEEFKRELYTRLDKQETVLREFFEKEGIEFVTTTEILRKTAAEGRQVYYTYDQHWTALGQAAVAEKLSRYFSERHTRKEPRKSLAVDES